MFNTFRKESVMNQGSLCLKSVVLFAVICIVGGAAMTQESKPAPRSVPVPKQQPTAAVAPPTANPADVSSVDAIIKAVYDVISGPAGKKRDWDRMRSLFVPGARLIPTGPRQAGGYGARVLTVDDYIMSGGPYLEKEGFFETEIARKTETFGQIVHAFSTYESRHKPEEKPFARGINSIQLMNDGTRWWIVTIFWQGEDEKNPLPEKYLKN
jgi:hypothetical protein